jgi:ATP-dependent DNA ligase
MARPVARRSRAAGLPDWIPPQLTQLVDAAPDGDGWLHEIKYDGYRMHARLDRGAVKLLTRTGLDWTHKYPAIANAVAELGARQAYLDGELCGVGPTASPASTSSSSHRTAPMRPRWSYSCSICCTSTARMCAPYH